jgi:hypothetical protein
MLIVAKKGMQCLKSSPEFPESCTKVHRDISTAWGKKRSGRLKKACTAFFTAPNSCSCAE